MRKWKAWEGNDHGANRCMQVKPPEDSFSGQSSSGRFAIATFPPDLLNALAIEGPHMECRAAGGAVYRLGVNPLFRQAGKICLDSGAPPVLNSQISRGPFISGIWEKGWVFLARISLTITSVLARFYP